MTHRNLVEAVVARFLWDRALWDDVVQNVMLKAVGAIGDFAGTCRFATWLYRITVNECIEGNRRGLRRKRRMDSTRESVEIFPDPNAPDGLARTQRREQHQAIRESVSRLPAGMRQAFDLFYRKGYTGAEAAEKLKISEKALFVRLSDARKKLRQALIDRGIAPC